MPGTPLRLEPQTTRIDAAWATMRASGVGLRWADPAELHHWLENTGAGWVIVDGDDVVAVGLAHVLDADEADELAARWAGHADSVPAAGDGYLTAAAVNDTHRGAGLHQRLIEARVAWLEERGADTIHTVSWLHAGARSHGPLRHQGFVELGRLDGYWVDGGDTGALMSRTTPPT